MSPTTSRPVSRRLRRTRGVLPRAAGHLEDQPLRAELFSVGQLERLARTMAGWHELAPGPGRGTGRLLARLTENETTFSEAYDLINDAVARGRQITPAAEWFIDNYHLIEDQVRIARRHLPRSYHWELPRLANGRSPGTPRVYDLVLELISHSHGRVDSDGLYAFVEAYQATQPLHLGELWAIPIMLRLALLENLRRVVGSLVGGRRERERAAGWVAEMTATRAADPARLVLVLAAMVEEDLPLTDPFVAELASRIHTQGSALAFAMSWLEERLAEQGQTTDHVFHLVTQAQAADQVSVSNSIGSLRALDATDWRVFVESMSSVEQTLREDPAGVYPTMDFATRDRYRHAIEDIARRSPASEDDVARAAITLSQNPAVHVGSFLVGDGRRTLERKVTMRSSLRLTMHRAIHRWRAGVYASSIALLTAVVTFILVLTDARGPDGWTDVLWIGLLTLCATQVAVAVVQSATTLLVGPRPLPRLDFSTGIPPEHATLVAVPTMLTDIAEIDDLVEALEVRFLANRDANLCFALLSDFRDADSEHLDDDPALLARASEAIAALNLKYPPSTVGGGCFLLLHRARAWNASEGVWMGHERKRGKLEDLNLALRGGLDRFATVVGPTLRLPAVKYVIALDSDTGLPRDTARKLASTLAHPLNRPIYDERRGRVVRGHAILQPRVGVSMASGARTRFSRLFAGEPGIDPYTRAVSDVFQDLFDEGSFIGKGIYDVDALSLALAGRLPINRVLSHDLLEGGYARSGLVSDVVLVEDFPATHSAEVARRTRWIRGDWQIASWLLGRVPGPTGRVHNPLSQLSKWKILDNLRRSVVPVALLALLLSGWAQPGVAAFATLAVAAILLVPGLFMAVAALARTSGEQQRNAYVRDIVRSSTRQLGREAFALATLPYDAFVVLTAIGQTLGRLTFTHRHLLSWRTASEAQRSARVGLPGSYAVMWVAPALALTLGAALGLRDGAALAWASPLLLSWLAAPAVAWWLGRPLVVAPPRLSRDDLAFLHSVARRTWRFFETFDRAGGHELPPDNFQEEPPVGAAQRTSPTNIGLALTASLAAHDFGYLCVGELITRTTRALAAMDRLQRYRGHFYNWYDTVTLAPLQPAYVSTVDSGNLAGHLLTLASGLEELADRPILDTFVFSGLADTLGELAALTTASPDVQRLCVELGKELESARRVTPTLPGQHQDLERLTASALELRGVVESHGDSEAVWWARAFESACRAATDDLTLLAPWLTLPDRSASLPFLLDTALTLAETARLEHAQPPELADPGALEAVARAAEHASLRLAELGRLAARCRELADFDYDLLYDRASHLLSIGYNVADHRPDASCYDLLASEARLASFVAIAQGKLPEEHWFSLGRQLTNTGEGPALLSWSGSMFEYLMPLLVMPTYTHTLLDGTYRAVVLRQIAYGRELGLPWGISESGYNKTDAAQNYQYRAFGVPGLGFKRGLADDRVVAPYASALALTVLPEAACANLRHLAAADQLGTYGFYEAIDYTPSRVPPGKTHVTVRSYMAHHQGMTFLALVHLLRGAPMQRRFDSDPAFRATDLLLQERVPRTTTIFPHTPHLLAASSAADDAENVTRVFTTPDTIVPEVHLLSNGQYHVAVTNAGGGYSRWRDLAVTRWHEDSTRDCWGTFGYLRDVATGAFWSLGHQPTLAPATTYAAIFAQGRAEFRRLDGEIETHVEIGVSPEDDVELRRVSLTNRGRASRTIELTSYAEVVLAPAVADEAHPAFSNLFVETELLPEQQAIVATRRPRAADEPRAWMSHHLTVHGTTIGEASYETARGNFLGRGRTPADPIAMYRPSLTGSEGAVLDPIVAIRRCVVLASDETARIHVVTGVTDTRDGALALIEKYQDQHAAGRVFELAWTHTRVAQRQLEATNLDIQLYERLASHIIFANPTLRALKSLIARNRGAQSGLWAYGISGDLPIAVVRVSDPDGLELTRQLIKAHAYWRLKGLSADLVVLVDDVSGYRQALMDEILGIVGSVSDAGLLDKPAGIFMRRSDQLSEEGKVLVESVARMILSDSGGSLADQIERRPLNDGYARHVPDVVDGPGVPLHRPPAVDGVGGERPDLIAFNGLGGFTQDGREYVITTAGDRRPGAPWVNVLANPWFGSVISESGSAYTWCENAHNYRLTPWGNDAVSDSSGEAFYLRDEDGGHFWSPTPLPAPAAAPYVSRHGFGYSIFEASERGVATEFKTYVAMDAPVKFVVLRIRNLSDRARRLSVTGCFDLVLGENRARSAPHVVSELDIETAGIFAKNAYDTDFAARVAFLDCSEEVRRVSGDRLEVLGRNGNPARPACMRRVRLSGRLGAALDPCLAMQVRLDLADGEEREIAFTFGSGRDLADARLLVRRFRGTEAARTALEGVWTYWSRALGGVKVETPDPALNFLANGWLLYQSIASRLWARSGFYQSGGAYGFRDQLQDAMALVHAEPAILRGQILRAAARQFTLGDVQHWWHPPRGRGVRTHISDDYLWLPYALCRYVTAIGDTGVMDEVVGFLDGRLLRPDEDSWYDLPGISEEVGTLYEHCVRAIRHGLRFGEHGLPLMGTGDWNDGMNLVGAGGRGESVWLGFFLYDVLTQFAGLALGRGDTEFAATCTSEAEQLRGNIEAHGWDGGWYRRAYFDDGEPLGSAQNVECQIDSLPQSWAVLSGAAELSRARLGLAAVDTRLVRRDLGVIQLFAPPFDTSEQKPGYIKGYLPGVRENGGQYTHAAVWAVMAFAAAGDVERAWELFDLINPVHHGDSAEAIATYLVEPYVVAGDVYANPQHEGRGGWTWYTGSAAWMYRLITESLLGLHLEVDHLRLAPLVPASWEGFSVHYRFHETVYEIRVTNLGGGGQEVRRVTLDGVALTDGRVPLRDDRGTHHVQVDIGG